MTPEDKRAAISAFVISYIAEKAGNIIFRRESCNIAKNRLLDILSRFELDMYETDDEIIIYSDNSVFMIYKIDNIGLLSAKR
jgi:hypothetical protein